MTERRARRRRWPRPGAIAARASWLGVRSASASPSSSSPCSGPCPPPGCSITLVPRPATTSRDRVVGRVAPSVRGRDSGRWPTTPTVLTADGMADVVHQLPHRHHPGRRSSRSPSPPSPPTPSPGCASRAGPPVRDGGRPAGGAAADGPGPAAAALHGAGPQRHLPRASGWPTPGSGCRWPSSCSTTTSASCRATSSSRRSSTAPRTTPCSCGWSCRCRCRRWPSFAIFQFLWVWNDLLVALVYLGTRLGRGGACPPGSTSWSAPAASHWHVLTAGGLRDHGRAADRVPRPAAVLRARDPRRIRQGMTTARPRPGRTTPSSAG